MRFALENLMSQPLSSAKQFRGIFAPTITGYHSDESINLSATRKFVRFLLDQGVHGLAPLGSAGEPVALTLQERMQLLEPIVAENNGQVPILAGAGDYSTRSTVELGLHARSLGCDGLMLLAPFFCARTSSSLTSSTVADLWRPRRLRLWQKPTM
jgi:dihydrodipicolinate synthase/N-acetylneuraminate lyase